MTVASASLHRVIDRIKSASAARTPLAIRGGGSKAFYGGEIHGEPLDTVELSGITSYEPTELVVTALAGTPLVELEAELAQGGQCLPFEPPRFPGRGTLGGMVAAGLSGPGRVSAGCVRDYLLGVTVLNGRGETLTFGGQVMKNVAGYDVSRVFAGSMGILGVICELSLKVMPVAPAAATLRFEMNETAALAQLNQWASQPIPLNASSWYDGVLHVRLSGARAAVRSVCLRLGGTVLEPSAAAAWWSGLRDQSHAFFDVDSTQLGAGEQLWRLSLPDTVPPLDLPGTQLVEWGGAQRWVRGTAPALRLREAAAACGGHATLMRAADKTAGVFSPLAPSTLAVHRRLKESFDPAGIFNRGRLYPGL